MPQIHPTSIIDSKADIDSKAIIGPYVVIEGPVKIGADTTVGPFCHLMGHTTIGAKCDIHAHVCIGDVPQDRAYDGTISYVEIGDECILREGVTVHCATGENEVTRIGNHCFLMSNVHVGHNCVLDDEVTMISGSLLGGHVHVGRKAIISGNAGVHQFVRIGELAMVSGLGKIVQDIPPFFMTDRDGDIVGLNFVGLRRAGYNSEERLELKEAYRTIYRQGNLHEKAIGIMDESVKTDAGRRLLDFMKAPSKRGITSRSKRRRAGRDSDAG